MRIGVLVAAIVLSAVSLPVIGYSQSTQSSDPAQTAGPDLDQIVCKSTPPPTGSRLGGGRECHTQREWNQRARDAQKQLEDKQMHGLQSCIGACGG